MDSLKNYAFCCCYDFYDLLLVCCFVITISFKTIIIIIITPKMFEFMLIIKTKQILNHFTFLTTALSVNLKQNKTVFRAVMLKNE